MMSPTRAVVGVLGAVYVLVRTATAAVLYGVTFLEDRRDEVRAA